MFTALGNERLVGQDESLLVGVSGGMDSMVLLHSLAGRAQVHVAHVNHRLRGRSSDADERLVRRAAEKLKVSCHVARVDVKAVAREQKLSIEMAARKCRHEFFARLAKELGIEKIALAHHADDQVELFFLRLLRGAGPEGLAGMPEMSSSPVDPALTIVRPFLDVTKEQIGAFAARHKIAFRDDATNASNSILRNRIRHKLIPLLRRDYQPGVKQTILRVMDLLRAESDFISEAGRGVPAGPFDQWPIALQRRHVQKQLYAHGVEANYDLIEHLRCNPGAPITIRPKQLLVRDISGTVRLSESCDWSVDSLSARVTAAGSLDFSGLRVKWSFGRAKPAKNTEFFDADKVGPTIILRRWQPGDRFQPIGMHAAVKLQDIFTNLKIPRDQRHRRVLATTAAGEIFWVEGVRIGERFKIEPSTRRHLKWQWQRHGTC